MEHMVKAIDATIASIEKNIEMRQSAIRNGTAQELLILHQLKSIYKIEEDKNVKSTTKRSTAKHPTTKRGAGKRVSGSSSSGR